MHVPMVTRANLKIPYIVTLLSLNFIHTFAHYTWILAPSFAQENMEPCHAYGVL